ncbi:3 ketodihydrosphingosine reductase [Trichuris trichiura]|uniref:3-dehydrosphinganine reductase n=1 Tax=Trichuris trichiura TaxID=36087 RepID=A0A077Z391_TRITR|nr:3 ketodihydrosphingosine reductase [Trichuris trichiura]
MSIYGFIATVALPCILLAIVAYILADRKRCQPIKNFSGYHVLITGGSKGIGKAIALEAVRRGADVSIIARNADALEQTAEELRLASGEGQKIFWYTADLSESWQRMSELMRKIELEGGPVDILINNVGRSVQAPLEDLKEEDFFDQMKLNYLTAACITKHVLISMKRRASDQLKNRRVCFVSSQAGQIGLYGYTAYSASKFALRGFAEALQMECRPYNVWITIAYPPHTDTEGFAEEWNLTPELTKAITAGDTVPMKPADVGRHILDSVAKGEFSCHMGLEGWMLSTVCAGMSPANSWRDTITQALAMGPLRLVGLFYLLKFNFTVSK